MRRWKRLTLAAVSSLLTLALLSGALSGPTWTASPPPTTTARTPPDTPSRPFEARLPTGCLVNTAHLDEVKRLHGLGEQIDYALRTVSFRRTPGLERKSLTAVDQPLLIGEGLLQDVDLGPGRPSVDEEPEWCPAAVHVDVPVSPLASTVNASDLLFGVSTTYQRLTELRSDMVGDWQYWLTDGDGVSNGGKLVLLLFEASEDELRDARTLLADVGIDAVVSRSTDADMPVRYVNLVPYLYGLPAAKGRRWLVLCDDDTFFPSMHELLRRLDTYDTDKKLYIGTLSEDVGAVERHGSQAFGGAGVFLTLPMAEAITSAVGTARLGCTSPGKVDEAGWQGDKLLRNCIYDHTDSRLVALPDLWQLDFRGDAAGFYEWGRKPLSLHHYRGGGWHEARPAQFSKVAYTCGEDCILQRFLTADNTIISGHSIAYYPAGITFEPSQVERTFDALWDTGWNFDFTFGPQRPPLKQAGYKVSWDLVSSDARPDGSVLQTYLRRADNMRWSMGSRPMGERDSIIELVWVPEKEDASDN